jgi:hypothetical protein
MGLDNWILRHPNFVQPCLIDKDKQRLISSLAEYFKQRRESAKVQVLDENGTPTGALLEFMQ